MQIRRGNTVNSLARSSVYVLSIGIPAPILNYAHRMFCLFLSRMALETVAV
jgi:hypothetical protein